MILKELVDAGKVQPPPWLTSNVHYLTIMGSHAYGVADTSIRSSMPDMDIYGFCIPKREMVFPHLAGEIDGFGSRSPRFEVWQKPHIFDENAHGGKGQEYDFQIYGIVKFFDLCRQGNPNMLDALYTREEHVLHCTNVGRMVRDNRRLFISKECWPKMRGYAFSQMHKAKNACNTPEIQSLTSFEEEKGIPRKTSYREVLEEFSRRKLPAPNGLVRSHR